MPQHNIRKKCSGCSQCCKPWRSAQSRSPGAQPCSPPPRYKCSSKGKLPRKETSHALLQAVLVTLQNVHSAIALLKFCSLQRSRPVRRILHYRRSKHLPESDAHALSDSSDVFQDRHTLISIAKPCRAVQFRPVIDRLLTLNGYR